MVGTTISVTALKLALIMWIMVVKGVPWSKPAGYLFIRPKPVLSLPMQRKPGFVKCIQKQIDKFALTTDDLQISKL
ncbi:MAG: transposase family protein [Bacteroidetes bacterium]|nr:MAG: transposase family protein [Bacteroidota bacterium]